MNDIMGGMFSFTGLPSQQRGPTSNSTDPRDEMLSQGEESEQVMLPREDLDWDSLTPQQQQRIMQQQQQVQQQPSANFFSVAPFQPDMWPPVFAFRFPDFPSSFFDFGLGNDDDLFGAFAGGGGVSPRRSDWGKMLPPGRGSEGGGGGFFSSPGGMNYNYSSVRVTRNADGSTEKVVIQRNSDGEEVRTVTKTGPNGEEIPTDSETDRNTLLRQQSPQGATGPLQPGQLDPSKSSVIPSHFSHTSGSKLYESVRKWLGL